MGSLDSRQAAIAERIMNILTEYVDLAMTKLCPSHGKMEELEAYYQVGDKYQGEIAVD